jgi:D-alanine-D-alanine ligase
MRIAVVFNKPGIDAGPDELDILDEVGLIEKCLKTLGHESFRLPVTLDLSATFKALKSEKPDLIFNLAESIENHGALVYLVPALLDVIGIPYTGTPTEPMFISAGKHLTKQILEQKGIPVPGTFAPSEATNLKPGKYIIKPRWEEGSLGLDEESVFEIPGLEVQKFTVFPESKYFIEPFIEGREFNVSILATENEPQVLAVAEILFVDFPENKPQILGFRAKWNEDSFEYTHTVRTYDLGVNAEKIRTQLADLSLKCWKALGLRGYGRVDFRMDKAGNPMILEVNSNPCISPGSGFFAACEYAGITFEQAVERIINDALKSCDSM